MAIATGVIARVISALALKEGAPTLPKGPPVAPPANEIVRTDNPSGESAGTSADISTMPSAPVTPAQAAGGLASKAPAQTADPEPARLVSVRPDGTLTASQVSSATERSSAAGTPNPASKRMNGAVGTRRPSTDLQAKRPGKLTARVVVAKTEREANAPIPPLPVMTPAKLEEASGAQAALAPAAPADATNRRCQSNGASSTRSATCPLASDDLRCKGAPLRQCGRASLLVHLAGDEMALLIEMVVDLGVN